MKLEEIGFYTLSDKRAKEASSSSRLMRCEIVLSNKCNFKCPYCRRKGDETSLEKAKTLIETWAKDNLFAIRFSGGEPTLYEGLDELVKTAKKNGVERIAISTNGSASLSVYEKLIASGVNDISVSLDACCASDGKKMAGGVNCWELIVSNINELSKKVYVTAGVVLTKDNESNVAEIVSFASSLGVKDVRVIPAAQNGRNLHMNINDELLAKHPILKYRFDNIRSGRYVRGIRESDSNKCPLVLDDMAVSGDYHYPCIIYFREGGNPIGKLGCEMRGERLKWFENHDTHNDPICLNNCLDVCVDYNNRYDKFKKT